MTTAIPIPAEISILRSLSRVAKKFTPLGSGPGEMSRREIRWPVPPHYTLRDIPEREAVECRVELQDGQTVTGSLKGFSHGATSIPLQLTLADIEIRIAVNEIKCLALTAPVAMLESDALSRMAVSSVKNFLVQFNDGSLISGETKGHIRTDSGYFLYVTEGDHPRYVGAARQLVRRLFIPAASTHKIDIGTGCQQDDQEPLFPEPSAPDATASVHERTTAVPVELLMKLDALRKSAPRSLRVGEALLELGLVTAAQVQQALHMQQAAGEHRKLGEILCQLAGLGNKELQLGLAHRLGIPLIDLSRLEACPEITHGIGRRFLLANGLAPVHQTAEEIYVAMANPLDAETIRELRFIQGRKVVVLYAPRAAIHAFLQRTAAPSPKGAGLPSEAFF